MDESGDRTVGRTWHLLLRTHCFKYVNSTELLQRREDKGAGPGCTNGVDQADSSRDQESEG